jgi:hypothetical protein
VLELYRRRLQGSTLGEDAVRIRQANEIERTLRLAGLRAEREAIFALARAHEISDAKSRELVREIDLMEERLGK